MSSLLSRSLLLDLGVVVVILVLILLLRLALFLLLLVVCCLVLLFRLAEVPAELPLLRTNEPAGREPDEASAQGVLREFTRPTSVLVSTLAMLLGDAERIQFTGLAAATRDFLKTVVARAALTAALELEIHSIIDGRSSRALVSADGTLPGDSLWGEGCPAHWLWKACVVPWSALALSVTCAARKAEAR